MSKEANAVASVERVATVRAELERGTVLAELGLDSGEWLALQRLTLAVFLEAESFPFELATRYCHACERASGSAADPVVPTENEAAGSATARKAATATTAGLPSYLRSGHVEPRILDAASLPGLDLDQTLPPSLASSQAMPFRETPGPAKPPPAVDRRQERDTSGETLAVDPALASAATLPFDRGAAMELMSVERYVEMVARVRSTPNDADAVMTSFGLETAEQRRKIHGLWQIRFKSNPKLRERFEKLVEERMRTQRPPT